MSQRIGFDWKFDEESFERGIPGFVPADGVESRSDGERRIVLVTLRALAALTFLILASGSAPLSLAQLDRMRTSAELATVLELDKTAWRDRDRERYDSLVDPTVDQIWLREWRDNWGARGDTGRPYDLQLGAIQRVSEELVQAEVYVQLPHRNWWQTAENRETRFYREANGLWLRTLPPEDFWGEPVTLRSKHFIFHYYAPDSESVQTAVPILEAAYTDLYKILGLVDSPADGPTTVVVKPDFVRSRGWESGVLELTSPLLSQVPKGMTNGDYLADRIFRQVSSLAIRESAPYAANRRWAFVFTVVRGWLGAELLGQPNVWRAESREVFQAHSPAIYPLKLADIDEYYVGGVPGRGTVLWRYAATSTVLDYVVAEYGEIALQELLDGFSHHGTWAGLIESILGISEEEFTESWNEYIAVEYGF
ncbi:MAG: hypothetical protein ACK2UO_02980 [Caldilineaceae bacterium]